MQAFEMAYIIPGGGLKNPHEVHDWVKRRLDKAISLANGTELFIPLSRYTVHKKPFIDEFGFPCSDAIEGARYLMQHGIKADHIRMETLSVDTVGDAYFTKLLFIDPLEITNITIFQSSFAMPRTQFLFQWIFSLTPVRQRYTCTFVEISDEGIDPIFLAGRIEKEAKTLTYQKELAQSIHDEKSFQDFLFTQHAAYSAKNDDIGIIPGFGNIATDASKSTY